MDNLYKLFKSKSGHQIKFNAIAIILLVILIFSFYFRYQYSQVIILILFALLIANYYVTYENENVDDFNNLTMAKLSKIQREVDRFVDSKIKFLYKTGGTKVNRNELYKKSRMTSLYMDANMINFLDSVIVLSKWNPELYYKLVRGTNNILAILEEIEKFNESTGNYPENIAEMLEIAMELRLKAINNIHDFVYTIPKSNRTNNYLNNVNERYRLLITRITDLIHSHYRRALDQRGITNMTKFINYFDSPRALDPSEFNKFY